MASTYNRFGIGVGILFSEKNAIKVQSNTLKQIKIVQKKIRPTKILSKPLLNFRAIIRLSYERFKVKNDF